MTFIIIIIIIGKKGNKKKKKTPFCFLKKGKKNCVFFLDKCLPTPDICMCVFACVNVSG
jgi:hypothetical protein